MQGKIADFGIPDIFQLVSSQGKSGSLAISGKGRVTIFLFSGGKIVDVQPDRRESKSLLGTMLRDAGYLTDSELKRALSFHPDALISSGDHIYFDLRYDKSARTMGDSMRSIVQVGKFDPSLAVLGTQNEEVLKRAVGPQIANLYGTSCRSLPTFFMLDDHDYFENDIATEKDGFDILLLLLAWRSPFFKGGVSFPPDKLILDLGRASQKLYLPEFLPDDNRPADRG